MLYKFDEITGAERFKRIVRPNQKAVKYESLAIMSQLIQSLKDG